MLDDDYGVAHVHQAVEDLQQFVHVSGVKPHAGLIQDIQGAAGCPLGELPRQLHPLGLATRQGRGWLAQSDVTQTHIVEGFELALDLGDVAEELHGLLDSHVQHVGDVLPLVTHL